ncbi:MAG: hypothetical protein HS128_23105 [Ideonella sp.]|nr:hypothetical protein [Ideonella sp.]MCC7457261.1 hypothetical protein [Nitrospira sp.]
MLRWVVALLTGFMLIAGATAQTVKRNFPANALRGGIAFGQPPEVVLNGQPTRLSPGARIHGLNNMLVMSGALVGGSAVVNYVVDSLGLVQEVWILTDAERARQPWPTTAQEAKTWSFDPITQVWTVR